MSMELGLMKTLLNKEFYDTNKVFARQGVFRSKETKSIKRVLDDAMFRYKEDLGTDDLEALFFAANPALTSAQKDVYRSIFQKVLIQQPLSKEVAHDVLTQLNREASADELADLSFKIANGEITSLHPVREFIDQHADNFTPSLRVDFEPIDIEYLLTQNDLEFKWTINIPTVAQMIPGINAGQLIVAAARPNTGKTSSHASLCAGPGGFIEQGARVMVLANEERATRVAGRYLTACCGMSLEEIRKNKSQAEKRIALLKDNLFISDATSWDMDRLEGAVKAYKPDILIADMADKFLPGGVFTAGHEQLKATYIRLRIVGKEYNTAIFAMSQLSAEAEGKVNASMSMLEGSKTGKASEADLLICITNNPTFDGQEEEDWTRHWCIVKNKLTGRHGKVTTVLNPLTARYEA
tara:strand:+ start:402 stop:1631 length:1230 start_codon:yes stop_codon:yes gene_type:complete